MIRFNASKLTLSKDCQTTSLNFDVRYFCLFDINVDKCEHECKLLNQSVTAVLIDNNTFLVFLLSYAVQLQRLEIRRHLSVLTFKLDEANLFVKLLPATRQLKEL